MLKKTLQTIAVVAITGRIIFAGINASADDSSIAGQPEFPRIVSQPEDQMAYFGSNATFTVKAVNTDGYQWLHNGKPMDGQTNTILTVTNCDIKDVGYYSCNLFKAMEVVPTRNASLMVYTNSIDPQTGVDPIVVFGPPMFSGGGQGTCPGKYAGYINFTKTTQQGWGWVPDTSNGNTSFIATDTNRTDTKIQYGGMYGDNGCNRTGVQVPNPAMSPAYRFTIYFANDVPTNAYAITLDGFKP